jgi:hypothetical protein
MVQSLNLSTEIAVDKEHFEIEKLQKKSGIEARVPIIIHTF